MAVLLSFTIAGPYLVAARPVEHVAGRHVDVGGVRLWVEEEGSGEPLVLIAGGPGLSHAYFHPWFSRLRDQFRVIYVDAYGTGKSSRSAQPLEYSLADDSRFDRVVYPELAVRYRDYAPRAEFVMFEKSGHFTFIEEPDTTFELLRAFLSK